MYIWWSLKVELQLDTWTTYQCKAKRGIFSLKLLELLYFKENDNTS